MENKKNNKGLITIIIILTICVLGFISYIIYDKANEKAPIPTANTTTKQILNEKEISYEELNCNSENKCDIRKKGNIKISIKKEIITEYNNEYYILYINDKEIDNKEKVGARPINKIIFLDDNYILVEYSDFSGEGTNTYYIYDNNAKEIYDISEINLVENDNFILVNYENNEFSILTYGYSPDYAYIACKYNESDIAKSEEKYKYLGNGKLSEREVIESKTASEIIKERYNMSCNELLNSTSKELEYPRESLKNILRESTYEKLNYNNIENDTTLLYKDKINDLKVKAKINHNQKYNNVVYNENNIKFEFNCLETSELGNNNIIECTKNEIIINDKIKYTSKTYPSIEYIFITNQYTIIQVYDQQPNLEEIIIYNNDNGKIALTITNSIINGEKGIVKINNNKLYYIGTDSNNVDELKDINTSVVDLSTENLTIEKIDIQQVSY